MNNEYKLYEWIFNPELTDGITTISLVENPATNIMAVQLSANQVYEFKLASEEERILVSPILIPEQLIYRDNINGEPAYIKASKETISKVQENFVKNGFQKNSNIEHSGDMIEGIVFTEQWLVRDSANDTINAYGFSNVPVGSWCVKAKLSEELWQDYVKSNKVKGFSVEGILGIQYINNNNKLKLKKMDKNLINKIIMSAIKEVAQANELTEFKDAEGKSYFATELAVDMIVTDADGMPIASTEFVIDAKKYNTDENGVIVSVEDVVAEPIAEEVQPEEVVVEAAEEVSGTTGTTITEDIVVEAAEDMSGTTVTEDVVSGVTDTVIVDEKDAKIAELEAQVSELEMKLAEMEAKCIEMEAKVVDANQEVIAMSSQMPASQGIPTIPVADEPKSNKSILDFLKELN